MPEIRLSGKKKNASAKAKPATASRLARYRSIRPIPGASGRGRRNTTKATQPNASKLRRATACSGGVTCTSLRSTPENTPKKIAIKAMSSGRMLDMPVITAPTMRFAHSPRCTESQSHANNTPPRPAHHAVRRGDAEL